MNKIQPNNIDSETRFALEALVIEHAWLLDHSRAASLAELYTVDGQLIGVGRDLIGRAAIEEWALRRAENVQRRSRHVCTNLRLIAESAERVHGTVLITLYRSDDDGHGRTLPLLVGDYEDLMVRSSQGTWLFAERRVVPAFTSEPT